MQSQRRQNDIVMQPPHRRRPVAIPSTSYRPQPWLHTRPLNQALTLFCRPFRPTTPTSAISPQTLENPAFSPPRQGCVMCGTFKATNERRRIWGWKVPARPGTGLASSSDRGPGAAWELHDTSSASCSEIHSQDKEAVACSPAHTLHASRKRAKIPLCVIAT